MCFQLIQCWLVCRIVQVNHAIRMFYEGRHFENRRIECREGSPGRRPVTAWASGRQPLCSSALVGSYEFVDMGNADEARSFGRYPPACALTARLCCRDVKPSDNLPRAKVTYPRTRPH